VAVLVALLWPRGPKEPVYEGKGLGYWLRDALLHGGDKTHGQAEKAVKSIGTNALPYLLQQFSHSEPRLNKFLNQCAAALRLRRFAFQTDEVRAKAAFFGLYFLGADAAPAVPTLAKHLGDPLRGELAAVVIARCGERGYQFFARPLSRQIQS